MSKILVVNASPMGDNSVTRKMTAKVVENYKAKHGDVEVIEHDTVSLNLPHLDGEILGAFFTPADDHDDVQKAHAKRSEDLVKVVQEADAIVFGVPMYNFGIPSSLKAYVDHICRAGLTFKYTETGPVGLIEDKPVYVVSARGGDYSGANASMDYALPYIKQVMGFLGISSVSLFQVNGVAMGDEVAQKAMAVAEEEIKSTVAA
jgi:FMN-dependent NADH-azoreductase